MRPAIEIARVLWEAEGDDIADDEIVRILEDVQVRFADTTSVMSPHQQAVLLFAKAAGELLRFDPGARNAAIEVFDRLVDRVDLVGPFPSVADVVGTLRGGGDHAA